MVDLSPEIELSKEAFRFASFYGAKSVKVVKIADQDKLAENKELLEGEIESL